LRLASEGKVDLNAPMAPVWIDPDIAGDPRLKLLTPRIALAHLTGFPNWRRMTDGKLSFTADPGSRFTYSGEGYEYLARFAEKKAGKPFDALAAELVFAPLGMKDTSFSKRDWFAGRVALPYDGDGKPGEPEFQERWVASDDVYSTTADYARFMLAVMQDKGVSRTIGAARRTIQLSALGELCGKDSPLAPADCPVDLGFGLGWAIFKYKDETVMMHTGGDRGVRTLGFMVPERKIGVVIFTNGDNGMKVARKIAGVLYDNPAFMAFLDLQAR